MQNLNTASESDKDNTAESGKTSSGFSTFIRGLSDKMRIAKEIAAEFLSFAALLTLMSVMLAYCA